MIFHMGGVNLPAGRQGYYTLKVGVSIFMGYF